MRAPTPARTTTPARSLTTPYNFVPLAKQVARPGWGAQISHSLPFKDGLSGQITLIVTAETDLVVGNKREKAANNDASGRVELLKTPDGRYVISGTSLRGVIRSTLEIATFSRLSILSRERRYALRDLAGAVADSYRLRMTETLSKKPPQFRVKPRAGFLSFDKDKGGWVIQPCALARIPQEELTRSGGRFLAEQRNGKTHTMPGSQKYLDARYSGDQEVWVTAEKPWRHGGEGGMELIYRRASRHKASQFLQGDGTAKKTRGFIVFTGQPSDKKYLEFVFFDQQPNRLPVDAELYRATKQIHEDSAKVTERSRALWHYWRKRGGATPVFYLTGADVGAKENPDQVVAFGLCQMFKFPAQIALGKVIERAQGVAENSAALDWAEAIFGRLPAGVDQPESGLKSRVSFSLLTQTGGAPPQPRGPLMLATPKPSFYPAYVAQVPDAKGEHLKSGETYRTWLDDDALPRGWKRYLPRAKAQATASAGADQMMTRFEAFPAGSTFSGVLRFHNLRPAELGALLWTLNFGGDAKARHLMGMAKPYGYGRVKIDHDWSGVRRNDRAAAPSAEACVEAFIAAMKLAVPAGWEASAQIKALKALAQERLGDAPPYDPTHPKDFQKLKNYGVTLWSPVASPSLPPRQAPPAAPIAASASALVAKPKPPGAVGSNMRWVNPDDPDEVYTVEILKELTATTRRVLLIDEGEEETVNVKDLKPF